MQIRALGAIPLFAGLSERQLEAVSETVKPLHVEAGTVIFGENDRGDSLYILVKGAVEITKKLGLVIATPHDEAKEKTLVRLQAPQFFGEMNMLEEAERSATVTACVTCDLLCLERAAFRQLAEADPKLGYTMVRNIGLVLCSRLRSTNRDVLKLTVALSLALGNR